MYKESNHQFTECRENKQTILFVQRTESVLFCGFFSNSRPTSLLVNFLLLYMDLHTCTGSYTVEPVNSDT